MADISGTSGNDSIVGTEEDDRISGGDGIDSLEGRGGDDLIEGGAGASLIVGGAGNDTLVGGPQTDDFFGGDGDDLITGNGGGDLFNGGAGADTMTGGEGRDVFYNVTAGDVIDGGEGGDDFDRINAENGIPEGGSIRVDRDPDNRENGTINYFNADGSEAGTIDFRNIEKVVPCFTPGTRIATPRGEVAVETLSVGDRIITRDNGLQAIRWIGRREMSRDELDAARHLCPVRISKGALGNDLPERDLVVSPNHRVLVANDKTALYFEESEVLVAAKHLTGLPGVEILTGRETTYIHLMFDQHEIILSDGCWSESFQPGVNSLAGVGNAQRIELLEIFPELARREGIENYVSARRSVKAHEAVLLLK
ncbi:Hint domain-containing protein [Sulfitobacter sp. HNIBRBA3233]|uniref:Hint domain-containing protein n=1 Tax=Sulfitobacter marinivivus TaxID=3158558 RepID=UPI0032DEB4EB